MHKDPKDALKGLDKLVDAAVVRPTKVSRRAVLLGVASVAGLAAVARSGWMRFGEDPAAHLVGKYKHLKAQNVRTIEAVAEVLLGASAGQALVQGIWDPAYSIDQQMEAMSDEERELLNLGFVVFEQAQLSFGGFSDLAAARRAEVLRAWQRGGEFQKSIFAVLHVFVGTSFGATPSAWKLMGYGGPCIPADGHEGRVPGQTVSFEWDERVP